MPEKVDLGYALGLGPRDAVAYFEAKGYRITWNWWESWQEANASAFTVAKVARADVLESIRHGVSRALAEGQTERWFAQNLEPYLKLAGWWGKQVVVDPAGGAEVVQLGSPHRLRTIYRTNLQSAYMAGRYKRQMEMSDARPYWMYLAINDARTRPAHRALHGKVFRFDDPIWSSAYPPNGINCRCRVRALSQRNLEREGLRPESSDGHLSEAVADAGIDKRTGEVIRKPVTVWTGKDSAGKKVTFRTDPGWNYNPGEAAYGRDVELMRKLTLVQDPAVRTQAVQALNNADLRHTVFAGWVDDVREGRPAAAPAQVAGLVDEDTADFARAQGVEPMRVLVVPKRALLHADDRRHHDAGIALSPAEFKRLPAVIAKPDAVYWDTKHKNLVYVAVAGRGEVLFVPVTADYSVKRVGRLDAAVTAFRVRASRLEDGKRFIRMPEGATP